MDTPHKPSQDRARVTKLGRAKKQVTIEIPYVMWNGIIDKAKEQGIRPSEYTTLIFEAAYAARVRKLEDLDLDATIAIIMVLSVNTPTATIARALKISEDLVVRIIAAWRELAAERK